MKKIIIFLTLCLYIFLIGCNSDSKKESSTETDTTEIESSESENDVSDTDSEDTNSSSENGDASSSEVSEETTTTESETTTELEWPEEFALWNVPIVENVTLTAANNKSVTDDTLNQGLVAVVEITGFDMDGFKAYGELLVNEGFALDPGSIPGALEYYTREKDSGLITITIGFGDDRTSIIVNNTAAEAEKVANATSTGTDTWPEALIEIPEFSYGTFKEIIDMTGGMYTLTYTDVTQDNIASYKKELTDLGYMMQEEDGSEMYFKIDGSTSYAVGFNEVDGTLQLIIMTSSM